MAITFRGVAFSGLSSTANMNPGEPTGTAPGDVMYALILAGFIGSTGAQPTKPTGWTNLVTKSQVDGTNNFYWRIDRIVRGGSAASTTWTGFGTGGSDYGEIHILGWVGVNNTTPEDAQSANGSSGTSGTTNPTSPPVTAVGSATVALSMASMWQGSLAGGWTPPSGYTLRSDNTVGNTNMAASKQLSSSGTETPGAYANGNSGGTLHDFWNGYTITLNPATFSFDFWPINAQRGPRWVNVSY